MKGLGKRLASELKMIAPDGTDIQIADPLAKKEQFSSWPLVGQNIVFSMSDRSNIGGFELTKEDYEENGIREVSMN